MDRHAAPAALRQIRPEQLPPDPPPVEGRVHEEQGDVAPLRRQDSQDPRILPSLKYC